MELQPQTQNPSAGFHWGGDAVFLGFCPPEITCRGPSLLSICGVHPEDTVLQPPLHPHPAPCAPGLATQNMWGKRRKKGKKIQVHCRDANPALGFSPLAKHQGGDITSSEHHHGGDRSGPGGEAGGQSFLQPH